MDSKKKKERAERPDFFYKPSTKPKLDVMEIPDQYGVMRDPDPVTPDHGPN